MSKFLKGGVAKAMVSKLGLSMVVLLLAALLSACSGTPSSSDARTVFENQRKETIQNGTVKVLSFKKVNGQSGEIMGIKFYLLEYEAEIEYPNGLNTHCLDRTPPPLDCIWFQAQGEVRQKGQKEVIKGEVNFEKTEKGWRAAR